MANLKDILQTAIDNEKLIDFSCGTDSFVGKFYGIRNDNVSDGIIVVAPWLDITAPIAQLRRIDMPNDQLGYIFIDYQPGDSIKP